MGNVYLAVKALFDGLGIDYVIPPMNSKKTLEIGSLHSPEEICLPYKIMIGNYIQAAEMGADTVLLTGSCGPCRFGEYCEMQMNLLNKLGYDFDFIVIDAPGDIGIKELLNRISEISTKSTLSKHKKFQSVKYALEVITLCDKLDEKANWLSGYEVNRGECKKLINSCKRDALECNDPKEMIKILKHYEKKFEHVETDFSREPVKIAIIGEIYTVIEPFSNLYIEDKLMSYGVASRRGLTPTWWVKNMVMSPTKLNSLDLKKYSKEYLSLEIGGHARECIGEAVMAYEDGLDGAIQIFPMGCMPEIVSKAILPQISKDKNFPIMTLVVDEMTGEAGYVTRIEAFIDLLERRKNHVLSRS